METHWKAVVLRPVAKSFKNCGWLLMILAPRYGRRGFSSKKVSLPSLSSAARSCDRGSEGDGAVMGMKKASDGHEQCGVHGRCGRVQGRVRTAGGRKGGTGSGGQRILTNRHSWAKHTAGCTQTKQILLPGQQQLDCFTSTACTCFWCSK